MNEFRYEELEEATDNYSSSNLIGKGSHGSIYKGTLKHGKLVVAVKKQSLGLCKLGDTSKLENEARILSSISPNQHLVNLLGTSHDSDGNQLLVMEHMPNGTLHRLLHSAGAASSPPSWQKRARMAIQIAQAIRFLHESKPLIIHRDIKSANILLDSSWNTRLADFGLAVRNSCFDSPSQLSDSVSLPAGTIGYLDPCYTTPCKLSTKNDVFSFGVVLLEIISGTKAIDVSRDPSLIVEWAMGLIEENRVMDVCDKRIMMPRYMEDATRRMLVLAIQCVSSNEESRPSMTEIVTKMESCVIERARFPTWVTMVQSLVHLKRRRKLSRPNNIITVVLATTTATSNTNTAIIYGAESNGDVDVDASRRKLLLREILAGDV